MSDQTGYNELYQDFVSHQHDVDQSKDVVLEVSGSTFSRTCFELSGWPLTAAEERECMAKLSEVEAERIRRDNRRLKGMNA
jgi:hypothetical protein